MMSETYRYTIDRFAIKSRLYKFSLSLCPKNLLIAGLKVSPWGVLPFDCLRKRGAGSVGSTDRAGKVQRKK